MKLDRTRTLHDVSLELYKQELRWVQESSGGVLQVPVIDDLLQGRMLIAWKIHRQRCEEIATASDLNQIPIIEPGLPLACEATGTDSGQKMGHEFARVVLCCQPLPTPKERQPGK